MEQASAGTAAGNGRGMARAVGLVVACAAAILVTLGAAVAAGAAPRDPARIAAVFPPWWTSAQAVSAAASAGQIAGAGGLPFILVLRGEPDALESRLRAAGAWLLLDPDAAGQCIPLGTSPTETR